MRLDVSFHYGEKNFKENGAIFIEMSPTQKLIIMAPGQSHPIHWHKKRTETFRVLWGDFWVESEHYTENDKVIVSHGFLIRTIFKAGNIVTIPPKSRHTFGSDGGCVVEETADVPDWSIYDDPWINKLKREARKWRYDLSSDSSG